MTSSIELETTPVASGDSEAPASIADPVPAVPAPAASAVRPEKRNYAPPPDLPTQIEHLGVRFDFNDGCRVALPEGKWRVRLSDIDTGNIIYETRLGAGQINSAKRYFVRFRIEVWAEVEGAEDEPVFTHDYSARGREVLVELPSGTLGDGIGWFPYAVKFQQDHGCRLTCVLGDYLIPLFRDAYPDITFITQEEVNAERFYATYRIGLFFDDDARVHQPCDFRHVGLHRTAGYILGVDPTEQRPRIHLADASRPIEERYVCIATQSSTQCKYWNNPNGWREVVSYLKEQGYRVICIDQKPVHGHEIVWNHIPWGAEDETGNRALTERARWLKHADFFIGLSSGLSWLAWAMEIPVVMISGFTHPTNEFDTPYRVINYHACNSCWNDVRVRFDHQDFFWCPRHKDTPQQRFECTRLITAEAVKASIKQIPGFVESDLSLIKQ